MMVKMVTHVLLNPVSIIQSGYFKHVGEDAGTVDFTPFFVVFYQKGTESPLKQHCSFISIIWERLTLHKNAAKQDAVRSERSRPFPQAEHAHLRTNIFLRCHLNTTGERGHPTLESLSCEMLSVNTL